MKTWGEEELFFFLATLILDMQLPCGEDPAATWRGAVDRVAQPSRPLAAGHVSEDKSACSRPGHHPTEAT